MFVEPRGIEPRPSDFQSDEQITVYSTVPFVGADGLEPPTSCVSDRYSNQTELHTHIFVAVERFELSTTNFRDWYSNQLRYTAINATFNW